MGRTKGQAFMIGVAIGVVAMYGFQQAQAKRGAGGA